MDEILLVDSVGALREPVDVALPTPILRGWFHAGAAVGAVLLTGALCRQSLEDGPRLLSLAIFGLSAINLYTVSAVYHIGSWRPATRRRLRALDRANIFVMIAATYTPLCYNILSGWPRPTSLATVWLLAVVGIGYAPFAARSPRWVVTAAYIGMGWVCLPMLPAFAAVLPWTALALALLGGIIYVIGALIYATRRPDPFPRVLGYHELFHLCVIAGGTIFAAIIWIWALPFPHP